MLNRRIVLQRGAALLAVGGPIDGSPLAAFAADTVTLPIGNGERPLVKYPQKRPMIGLSLFLAMRPAGAARWTGQIYNADDGKVYESHISLPGPDLLRVEGCVGAFCGGETWSRAGR